MTTLSAQDRPAGLERIAWLALLAFAATLQVSIAAAQVCLALTAVLWLTLVIRNRESIEVPWMFWPLASRRYRLTAISRSGAKPWSICSRCCNVLARRPAPTITTSPSMTGVAWSPISPNSGSIS